MNSNIQSLILLFSKASVEFRHALYVWWLTGASLTGIMLLASFKDTVAAKEAINALASIMTYVVCAYLGIEMISRSNVLDKVGERLAPSTTSPSDNKDQAQ